jgi:hypothetical protein
LLGINSRKLSRRENVFRVVLALDYRDCVCESERIVEKTLVLELEYQDTAEDSRPTATGGYNERYISGEDLP